MLTAPRLSGHLGVSMQSHANAEAMRECHERERALRARKKAFEREPDRRQWSWFLVGGLLGIEPISIDFSVSFFFAHGFNHVKIQHVY